MNPFVIITIDNVIYAYSTDKKYSNNTNCLKLDGEYDITLIQNQNINIFSGQEFLYTSDYKSISFSNGELIENDMSDFLYDKNVLELIERKYVLFSFNHFTAGDNENYNGEFFGIKANDNNIYNYIYSYNYNYGNAIITEKEEIIYTISSDEKIVNVYLVTSDGGVDDNSYIKTDKNLYQYKKRNTNKEECEKYLDVECVYTGKWEKEEKFSEKINDIVYIDGDLTIFVTKNGKIYTKIYN